MSVEIISQHSNTLPSGFKITFTVGRIVKANPHSLPVTPSQATDSPAGVTPSTSLPGSQSQTGAP